MAQQAAHWSRSLVMAADLVSKGIVRLQTKLAWHNLQGVKHPKKRLYRARAHSNPLNDQNFDTPAHPDDYDWCAWQINSLHHQQRQAMRLNQSLACRSLHYPAFFPEGGIDSPASTRATLQPLGSAEEGAAGSGAQPAAAADGGGGISPPKEAPMVRFADVGCGFGGLLVKLAPLFPDTLILGLELRDKVCYFLVCSPWICRSAARPLCMHSQHSDVG